MKLLLHAFPSTGHPAVAFGTLGRHPHRRGPPPLTGRSPQPASRKAMSESGSCTAATCSSTMRGVCSGTEASRRARPPFSSATPSSIFNRRNWPVCTSCTVCCAARRGRHLALRRVRRCAAARPARKARLRLLDLPARQRVHSSESDVELRLADRSPCRGSIQASCPPMLQVAA